MRLRFKVKEMFSGLGVSFGGMGEKVLLFAGRAKIVGGWRLEVGGFL